MLVFKNGSKTSFLVFESPPDIDGVEDILLAA